MVTIHIEKLVISGVPPHEQRLIAAAFRTELARLIERHGIPAGLESGDRPVLRSTIPSHGISAGNPRQNGVRAARSLYGALGHSHVHRSGNASE